MSERTGVAASLTLPSWRKRMGIKPYRIMGHEGGRNKYTLVGRGRKKNVNHDRVHEERA